MSWEYPTQAVVGNVLWTRYIDIPEKENCHNTVSHTSRYPGRVDGFWFWRPKPTADIAKRRGCYVWKGAVLARELPGRTKRGIENRWPRILLLSCVRSVLGQVLFTLCTIHMQRIVRMLGAEYKSQVCWRFSAVRWIQPYCTIGDVQRTLKQPADRIAEIREWMINRLLKKNDDKTEMVVSIWHYLRHICIAATCRMGYKSWNADWPPFIHG